MITTMSFSNPPTKAHPGTKSQFFHLYKAALRRLLGLGCLYAVFLQFTYTMPFFSEIKNNGPYYSEKTLSVLLLFLGTFPYTSLFFSSALICLASVLFSVVAYGYMHNRRAADFYHALPASRKTMLLASFSAVFTVLELPLIISGLIVTAFYPALGLHVPFSFLAYSFLYVHIIWFAMLFVMLSLTAFVAVNTATVIETAGYSCAFSIMGSILYYIWVTMCNISFETYVEPTNVWFPYFLSPVFAAAYAFGGHNPHDLLHFILPLIVWVVIAAGLLYAALVIYHRRHSEIAQKWGYQSSISFGAKIFASVLGAIVLGFFFAVFGLGATTCYLLGAVLGAPLGYIVVEVITGKGFGSLKKALPKIVAASLAVVCCSVYFAFGGFGYDSKVPHPSTVVSIEVTNFEDFYSYHRISDDAAKTIEPNNPGGVFSRRKDFILTINGDELKEAVIALHQNAVNNDDEGQRVHHGLELAYYLSPVGTMRRSIESFSVQSVVDIWQAPGYLQANNPFFELKPEYLRSTEVFDRLLSKKGQLTADQAAQLIVAIRQDFQDQTLEDMLDTQNNREVGIIRFNVKDNREIYETYGELFHYEEAFFYLRPQCKNAMALMKQWGYTDWTVDSASIERIDIESADFSFLPSMSLPQTTVHFKSSEYPASVTQPEAIAEILNAATYVNNSSEGGVNLIYACLPSTFYSEDREAMVMYIDNQTLIEIASAYDVDIPYIFTLQECEAIIEANGGEKFLYDDGKYGPSQAELYANSLSIGEYLEQNLPQLLNQKPQAVRQAMYHTPFLSSQGFLLYNNSILGTWDVNETNAIIPEPVLEVVS